MKLLIAIGLGLCMLNAQAQESAYTVRATELKEKPFADAPTVVKLAEQAKVEVITRQASWMQVKAGAATGWVKFLSLRMGDGKAQTAPSGEGMKALFNVAATGKSGSTTTTGVRGLSEEKLKKAEPNPQALKALQEQAVSADDARGFAEAGKLDTQKMDYLAATEKGKK